MHPKTRAARCLALILPLCLVLGLMPGLPGASPAYAAGDDSLPPSALPDLPPQTDPWLYRGSDVPHDKEWYFGTLPNGLRWAVRHNGVPPGQVSIRIRMDVGSLFERPGEEGFAHLLEHLVFRQSRYLGEAQAIPTWQRLGASFGTDTNAETTPTQTAFKIDLPGATPAGLNESFKILSGMMIAPTLSESDIRTEVPIVLAEKREHGGAGERVQDASRAVIFAGQPMGDHSTIGSVASVAGAHEAAVRAFHARWYRPENAAIIVAGDADPRLMAALIAKWFGDWPAPAKREPVPDFGAPMPEPGADPANPVGPVRVVVEPDVPRSLSFAVERAWHEKHDTITYNQGLMIDQVGQAIINRRLETRARVGASYIAAQIGQENDNRSIDGTFVQITPIDGDWRRALHDVRAVIADALASPPSTEEIAREIAEINVTFESQVQQRTLAPGGRLADDLVQALDIHETVASPETVLQIFQSSIPLFTPDAVLAHSRKLFQGAAIRAIYVTPDAGDGDDAALRAAMLAPAVADPRARGNFAPVAFSQLPVIGQPAPPPTVIATGLYGIEQLNFANGVKAMIWPTPDDPGRVTVKVRFGTGYRAFGAGDAANAALARLALVSSGESKLGQEELDRISTGRKLGFDFRAEDGFFTFQGDTRAEDLTDQLYLFAAKFAMPRWDAAPLLRAKALARLQAESYAASPQGVLEHDLRYLQHGNAPRYAPASSAQIAAVTPESFRALWAPILAAGPIEVQVFGDYDRAKAIAALQATFGALPARSAAPVVVAPESGGVAAPNAAPLILRHKGDANQAAALVSWPTGGGAAGLRESRQLEVLAQLFTGRLIDAMREKAGASYAPQVASEWPMDLSDGGAITALAQLQPEAVPAFFGTADKIAADLAATPPGADELARVIEPMRQQITRAATSTAFFMWQVEGATQQPSRLAAVRTVLTDYTEITPEQLQALAARYLKAGAAWRLAVLPEAKAKVGR